MDGLTVPLNCVAAVNPNTANRVRIAIADTSDPILDAAVFIAQQGVRAPGSGAPTTSNTLRVIEYFHPEFGHYFVTASPVEIDLLDNGALSNSWERTELAFDVYVSGYPGSSPVCRFFSASFAPKSSHFYTPDSAECEIVKNNPAWTFEAEVFNVILPSKAGRLPGRHQAALPDVQRRHERRAQPSLHDRFRPARADARQRLDRRGRGHRHRGVPAGVSRGGAQRCPPGPRRSAPGTVSREPWLARPCSPL